MFTPIGNKILIDPDTITKEEISEGGLIIGIDTANEHKSVMSGKVISVGKDVLEIRKGNVVYYELHSGQTFLVQGKEVVTVGEPGVIGFEVNSIQMKRTSINEEK